MKDELSRRTFLGGAAVAATAGAGLLSATPARAASARGLAASPPAGFVPFSAPGRIVKVEKADCMQPNGAYPKPEDAKAMLERGLTELTGKSNLVESVKEFVHPDDKVCVKVNGIAVHSIAQSKEVVLPFVDALIAAGVKPQNITMLEQFYGFFASTRLTPQNLPSGVQINIHNNKDTTMDEILIPGTGVSTKFVRAFTDATAVINFSLIKDHSICGYTGCMKNMTHGCQIYPHYFHTHHASPQIALLYAQDVVKSRVRLNIAEGFRVMADGGPLGKQPQHVYPHGALYVSTDPVAMDATGWDIIEKYRADHHLPTLTAAGREPSYIRTAADMGLGVFDRQRIQVKTVSL